MTLNFSKQERVRKKKRSFLCEFVKKKKKKTVGKHLKIDKKKK